MVDKRKRINIALKEDLHTKAKVISVLKNVTLNEYFEQAILKAVERDKRIIKEAKL